MHARSVAVALTFVTLGGCGSTRSGSGPAPSMLEAPQQKGRHVRSISGGGSGYFKLVVGFKRLSGSGGCAPGADQWYIPGGTFITIDPTHPYGFDALSTMTLPSTAPVTFTNSEPPDGDADLVVSTSSTTYVAAGSFDVSGLVWTPPYAGTFYAGYRQPYDANDTCSQFVYYQGTLQFTWTQ